MCIFCETRHTHTHINSSSGHHYSYFHFYVSFINMYSSPPPQPSARPVSMNFISCSSFVAMCFGFPWLPPALQLVWRIFFWHFVSWRFDSFSSRFAIRSPCVREHFARRSKMWVQLKSKVVDEYERRKRWGETRHQSIRFESLAVSRSGELFPLESPK